MDGRRWTCRVTTCIEPLPWSLSVATYLDPLNLWAVKLFRWQLLLNEIMYRQSSCTGYYTCVHNAQEVSIACNKTQYYFNGIEYMCNSFSNCYLTTPYVTWSNMYWWIDSMKSNGNVWRFPLCHWTEFHSKEHTCVDIVSTMLAVSMHVLYMCSQGAECTKWAVSMYDNHANEDVCDFKRGYVTRLWHL